MLTVLQVLGRVERMHELLQRLVNADNLSELSTCVQDLTSFSPTIVKAYEARYPRTDIMNQIAEAREKCFYGAIDALDRKVDVVGALQQLARIDRCKEGVVRYAEHLSIGPINNDVESPSLVGGMGRAKALAKVLEGASAVLQAALQQVLAQVEGGLEHSHLLQHVVYFQLESAVEDLLSQFIQHSDALVELYPLDLAIMELLLMRQHLAGFRGYLADRLALDPGDCLLEADRRLTHHYTNLEQRYAKTGLEKALALNQVPKSIHFSPYLRVVSGRGPGGKCRR